MAGRETTDGQRVWDVLFDGLLAGVEEVTQLVLDALQAEIPVYRSLPLAALAADVRTEVSLVLQTARLAGAPVGGGEMEALVAIGDARALQGIPVDDMLRAWRIGVQLITSYARQVGRRLDVDDASVLDFIESLLAWSDVATIAMAGAHRRAELVLARADENRRAAFVGGALFGSLAPPELTRQAEAAGLDPTREYVAVRASPLADGSMHALERALGFHDAVQHRRGLGTPLEGALGGLLREPPRGDIDAVVGVGPPRPLYRLPESYRLAARAWATALSFGRSGVHDLSSLGLRAAVAADPDVSEALHARYLEPLKGASATETIATLRAYLASGMRFERTAEQLFVHQNTVRYRISRFEELTGANLRDTEVAFEVWWATERAAMRL